MGVGCAAAGVGVGLGVGAGVTFGGTGVDFAVGVVALGVALGLGVLSLLAPSSVTGIVVSGLGMTVGSGCIAPGFAVAEGVGAGDSVSAGISAGVAVVNGVTVPDGDSGTACSCSPEKHDTNPHTQSMASTAPARIITYFFFIIPSLLSVFIYWWIPLQLLHYNRTGIATDSDNYTGYDPWRCMSVW